MQKTISEILDLFTQARTREEKVNALRANQSHTLKQVLIGAYNPNVRFVFDHLPEYRKSEIPDGMGFTSIHQELARCYLFEQGNPRASPNLTHKRREEILTQILEALEDREAEIFGRMILKKELVPGLTYDIIQEAFPGMLPFQEKQEVPAEVVKESKNYIQILKDKYTQR